MSAIAVKTHEDGVLVVDSRLIADRLEVEHRSLMKTILAHQDLIEQELGLMRFEIAEIEGRGRPEKFVYLTEAQATFVMTLSRNTKAVVRCKLALVQAFEKATEMLRSGISQPRHPSSDDDRILAKAKRLQEEMGLKPAAAVSLAIRMVNAEDTKTRRAAKALLADLPIRAKALLDMFRRGGLLTFNDITQWEGFPVVETRFDLIELEKRGLIERFVDDEGVTYYRASQTESATIDQTPRLDRP